MTIRYFPNTGHDPIPEQAQIAYEDYKKIKGFEDVGYFLNAYVVSGGAVTANATRNDTIDATDIVVSLNNDIMAREGVSFRTKTSNTTYYLDIAKEGDWSWGTAHPAGSVGSDYLTVASVTTDADGLVNVITDTRGPIGGFRLKADYGLEDYVTKEMFDTQITDILVSIDNSSALINTLNKMRNGEVVTIVAYGDSMTMGYKIGSVDTQTSVANPYPKDLETKLRTLYSNSNITVINSGVGGYRSIDAITNLQEKVLNHNPDMCILMFGINDTLQGYTVEQYLANMTSVVEDLLKSNIETLLMSPSPTFDNDLLLLYTNATHEIALKYGVGYISMQNEILNRFENRADSLVGLMPDGVHFVDDKYALFSDIILGQILSYRSEPLRVSKEMSVPLVYMPNIDTDVTGVYTSSVHFYKKNYIIYRNSALGEYIRFVFFVEQEGIDLYLSSEKNTFGGTIQVTDNGAAIKTINFFDSDNSIFESENLLLQNLTIGLHVVEMKRNTMTAGQAVDGAGLALPISFEFKKSSTTKSDTFYNLQGAAARASLIKFKSIIEGTLRYKNASGGSNGLGTLIRTGPSVELKTGLTLAIEAEGKLAIGTGISWFGNIAENDAGTHPAKANPGYLVYWETNKLFLFSAGVNGALATVVSANPTLDLTSKHTVRITHTSAGVINVLLDGVVVLTATNTAHNTGYFGLYSAINGTLELSRFEYVYE